MDDLKHSDEELDRMHKSSFGNKERLAGSKECGCFNCLEKLPLNEVEYWEDQGSHTAVCPKCNIDSLIGSGSEDKLSDELLLALRQRFFLIYEISRKDKFLQECRIIK